MTSKEYVDNIDNKNFRFRIVVDHPEAQNIDFIHPLKQPLVNDIIAKAKTDAFVKRVIVFGSAITNRCNPFSDLDVCIDWEGKSHNEDGVYVADTQNMMRYISLRARGNCDVLSYDDITNIGLKRDIDRGVLVYEHNV